MNKFTELNINKRCFNPKDKAKYIDQRITRGFANCDLWDIDEWFLEIIPNMLKEFNKKVLGFPNSIAHEYFDKNKEKYMKMIELDIFKKDVEEAKKHCTSDEDIVSYLFSVYSKNNEERLSKFRKEFEDGCVQLWHDTINKMISLFVEARGAGYYNYEKDKIKSAKEGLELFKKHFFNLWL